MQSIIKFWYKTASHSFWQAFLATFNSIEGSVAVGETIRNIGKPIFQDYTPSGRVVGVLMRLARIVVGGFLYLLISLFYLIAYCVWLFAPIGFAIAILGSFLAY